MPVNRRGIRRAFSWRTAAFFTLVTVATPYTAYAGAISPFDLQQWRTSERVRLKDFSGQILVLDFFAWWCAPCEPASRELEAGIQRFYAARGGNPRGVPVRVLSVNLEEEYPDRTDAFVRRTGSSLVASDFSGALLKELGGEGIPFLVVVDGTGSRSEGFDVVYRHGGFEGVRKIRQIIDGLGEDAAVGRHPGPEDTPLPDIDDRAGASALVLQAEGELLSASDIFLTDNRVGFRVEPPGTEFELAFGFASFNIDYQPYTPVDFFGYPDEVIEYRYSGEASLRRSLTDRVTLLASAGYYDGYPDYRRVWIATRYQQKYDNPGFSRIEGYEAPDPWGANVSLGARYEYVPARGFAELKLGYAHDRTAPGYEDGLDANGDFVLIRGRENFDTGSLALSSENILTKRLRALNEFSVAVTTDRDPRYSWQGSLNYAAAERWVVRGYAGLSREAPRFDAEFFGLSLEWEVTPSLHFDLTGRYYQDSGEIEESLPVTSAAPPLRSWEFGLGLRYAWERAALKLQAGPVWTDYSPQPGIAEEFTYLYSDRTWALVQVAFSVRL